MFILTGCTGVLYFECEIGEPEKADLPQTVSVINVPCSYSLVETKFQPAEVSQDFRYRATIDGTEYSAAVNPGRQSIYGQQSFQVVVPENDSYFPRTIMIETSVKDLFGKKEWGDWRTVYDGTQAALPESEPLALEGIGSRGVRLVTDDGTNIDLDIETNSSGIALRAILLRGDVVLTMFVENDMMITGDVDANEVFRTGVPLNHVTYHSINKGDIYMGDSGNLVLFNETKKHGVNGRETFLGTVSKSSLEAFSNECYNNHSIGSIGKEMTLTLL